MNLTSRKRKVSEIEGNKPNFSVPKRPNLVLPSPENTSSTVPQQNNPVRLNTVVEESIDPVTSNFEVRILTPEISPNEGDQLHAPQAESDFTHAVNVIKNEILSQETEESNNTEVIVIEDTPDLPDDFVSQQKNSNDSNVTASLLHRLLTKQDRQTRAQEEFNEAIKSVLVGLKDAVTNLATPPSGPSGRTHNQVVPNQNTGALTGQALMQPARRLVRRITPPPAYTPREESASRVDNASDTIGRSETVPPRNRHYGLRRRYH